MLNQPNYGHGHAYEAAHGHTQTHSGGAYTAAHYQQQQQQIHAQAQAQAQAQQQQQQQQQHFPIHTAAAAAAAAAAVASATAGSQYLAAGSGSAGNSHLHQNQQSALAQHLISAGNAGGYILQQQQQQHHQHLQHQQQQQHLLHQSYHSPPGGSMVAASHNHGAANHAAAVAAAAVMAASSAVPAAVQPPPPPPQEEITTIFVVGFPPDMQEREFQNMFIFSPGFEAATLKIPAKDEIGFAKFRTRLQALEARDILSGRKVDAEKGSVLKAEMAKKNLHTKRGLSNEFFHPAFQQYGILNMQLSAAAAAAAAANGGAGGPAHLAAAQTAAMAAAAVSGATAAAHAGSHGLPPLASGYLSSSTAGAAGSHLALPAPPGRDESFGDARNTRVPQGYGSSGMGGNAGSVSAAPPGVILYGTGATGVSPPALEHLFASSAVNSPGMTVLGGPGVGESSGIVELIDEQNSHSTASQAGTGGFHQQQQQQQAAVHAHYAMEAAAAAAYAANAKQAGSGLPRPSSAASMASATSAATTAGGASGQMHKRFASPLPSPSASQTTFSGFVSDRRSNDRDPIMDELEQQFAVTSVCDTSSAGNETNMTVVDGIACAAAAASSENAVASPRPHRPASASPPSSSVPLTMPASSMPSAAASPLSSLPASPATSSTLFKPSSLVGSSPHGPSPLNPNTNGNAAAGTSPGNRPASPLASPASTTSSSGSLASFAVGTQPNANQVKPARISGLSINASLANRWTKGGLATTATASAAHMLSPATPVVNYDAPNYQAPPGNAVYLPGGVPAAVAADASQLLRQLPGFKRVLMAGDGVVLEFEEPKHAEEAKSWAVKALQGSVREDEILVVATNASSEVEQQQHYQQVMDLSRSATL